MDNRIDIKELSRRLGVSVRQGRRLCAEGRLPGAKKVDNRWRVPESAHLELCKVKSTLNVEEIAELQKISVRKREGVQRKLGIIKGCEQFSASFVGNGESLTDAIDIYCKHNGIHRGTLYRWMKRFREEGLLGLVDTRGGNGGNKTISPEAWEYFKSLYLDQRRLSVKLCWQVVNHLNRSEGRGWRIPELRSMHNYIDRSLPLPVQVLHREGQAAYDAKCAPYIITDPDSIEPGQMWVGDHHQFNCWIRHRNKWVRPWMTAWEDMRSRKIVGRDINVGPNQTTILKATKRAIEKYGPPDSAKIDNGRDYDSELWTGTTKKKRRAFIKSGYLDEKMMMGIYGMLDISISFSIPYHPQSKPVERFFKTMDGQFTKTMPTYCGRDVAERPDYLKDLLNCKKAIAEAYDLEGFAELAGEYIETVYNQSPHTGAGMEGRTPEAVFNQRTSRRVLKEGVLDLLLRVWSGELTVGKNGVKVKNAWYGQYDRVLMAHQGKKVRVAYDPDDIRQVYVYDAVTLQLITISEQARIICYGDAVSEEDLREGMRRKSRAIRAARESRDSSIARHMDIPSLAMLAARDNREIEQQNKQDEKAAAAIRPASTPLDKQVKPHRLLRNQKLLKKAAGAENIEEELHLDLSLLREPDLEEELRFDLSLLKPPPRRKMEFDILG